MSTLQIYSFLLLVLGQLVTIFGGFFMLAFTLSVFQGWLQKNYMRAFGWRGILWTAWIGTPIHELGHIFFAKIFGHRISKVSLFKPDKETGVLGEVEDTYNPNSIYQNTGNFFIGIGPLIFSSLALAGILYLFIPNHDEVFSALSIERFDLRNVLEAIREVFANLFTASNLHDLKFWIFLYLSFAIASHMAPSRADLRRAGRGFLEIVVVLIILNGLFMFLGFDVDKTILDLAAYVNAFLVFLIYAIAVSIVHLVLSLIIRGVSKFGSRN